MPTERSTSRGRPSKRSARSTSASRKVKPQKFSPQQQKKPSPPSSLRKSKSPQKSIPKEKARKTRSSSRTRKISTAPPAVSARKKKEKAGSRPSSPQSYTTTIKTTTLTATRGPPRPATASPLPYTNALRGSLSPPTLRSRTSAAITSNQRGITHSPSQPRKTLKRKLSHFEQIKNSAFSRQLGKFGNSIKKRTFVIFNKFKTNWRYLFILFFLLLLIGIFYKFNKQLIQLNKQFVEFVQEQYVQQRHIFGNKYFN